MTNRNTSRDPFRSYKCIRCNHDMDLRLVRAKCPYCDRIMRLALPEYEFYDDEIGCEYCHRKSHLKIRGYYKWNTFDDELRPTTNPMQIGNQWLLGGRLISIEPVVPPELVLGVSDKIPEAPRQTLESAVKCLEIGEYGAVAMLCRLAIQTSLRDEGVGGTTPSGMINRAKSQDLISDLAHKQAEAVTFMGNKSAHPNEDELLNVRESDARQGLQMVRRILLELYDPDKLGVI